MSALIAGNPHLVARVSAAITHLAAKGAEVQCVTDLLQVPTVVVDGIPASWHPINGTSPRLQQDDQGWFVMADGVRIFTPHDPRWRSNRAEYAPCLFLENAHA
jgi:hypothetical protein